MLNIFFSLFLLGMLIVLCGKAISRAMHQQQPLNSKEAALLIALSLGRHLPLNAGVSADYKTQQHNNTKPHSPPAPKLILLQQINSWLPSARNNLEDGRIPDIFPEPFQQ